MGVSLVPCMKLIHHTATTKHWAGDHILNTDRDEVRQT